MKVDVVNWPLIEVEHDISDRLYRILRDVVYPQADSGYFSELHFHDTNLILKGRFTRMNIQMEVNQQVGASVVFLDRRGQPARVDSVAWSSSDPTVASVEADPEDISKAVVTTLAIGDAIISARADADLDVDEVREIELVGTVLVREAEAVTGELSFGEVSDI